METPVAWGEGILRTEKRGKKDRRLLFGNKASVKTVEQIFIVQNKNKEAWERRSGRILPFVTLYMK